MKSTLKTWTGLGLATALAGAGLAGCAGEGGENGEGGESAVAGEAGEAGEGGEAGESGEGGEAGTLAVEQRLAFMAGHVEAGLALYRAGEAEAAAPHLMHPVSETHANERAGLDALGFDAAVFETVSAGLESGKPASEIEEQLADAESNIAAMQAKTGGDPAKLISYLMELTAAEYKAGVVDGAIAIPGEYADAWGFARVARKLADALEGDNADDVRAELDKLIALWPESAPVSSSKPAPAAQVVAQTSRVALVLGRKSG